MSVTADAGEAELGLSGTEAAARLKFEGPNTLPHGQSRTLRRIVIETLREPMFALLLAAGLIYLILGDLREALILFLFGTTSVSIAVAQEARTERVSGLVTPTQRLPGGSAGQSNVIPRGSPQARHREIDHDPRSGRARKSEGIGK
jgi:hypothetical protein